MAVVHSVEQYQALQKRRIAKLRKLKRRGPITTAKFMALQLRAMCPRGRGVHPAYPHMYQTIKRNKGKVSMGGVNKITGFPYVHWVNATPGAGLKKVKLVYPFGNGTMKSYAEVARTGTPGFYWIAQRKARQFGRDSMITATRRIIGSNF